MAESFFAQNLRKAMNDRQITVSKLSELTGASISAIGTYLNGSHSPTAWMLARIAEGLAVSVDFLIFGEERDYDEWIPFETLHPEENRLYVLINFIPIGPGYVARIGKYDFNMKIWTNEWGVPIEGEIPPKYAYKLPVHPQDKKGWDS